MRYNLRMVVSGRRVSFTHIEHHIKLGQVLNWAQHTMKEGPAGIIKRERVRALLGNRS